MENTAPAAVHTHNAAYAARFTAPIPGFDPAITPEKLFVAPQLTQTRPRGELLLADQLAGPWGPAVQADSFTGPGVYCLTGPAGSGKSTLAAWFCKNASRPVWVVDASALALPADPAGAECAVLAFFGTNSLAALGAACPGGLLWLDGCADTPGQWDTLAAHAVAAGLTLVLSGRRVSAPAGCMAYALAPFCDSQRRQLVQNLAACGVTLDAGLAADLQDLTRLTTPRVQPLYYLPAGLLLLARFGADAALRENDWRLLGAVLAGLTPADIAPGVRWLSCRLVWTRQRLGSLAGHSDFVHQLAQEAADVCHALPGDDPKKVLALCPALSGLDYASETLFGYYQAEVICDALDDAGADLSRTLCSLLEPGLLPQETLYFIHQRVCAHAADGVPDFASREAAAHAIGREIARMEMPCASTFGGKGAGNPVSALRIILKNTMAVYRIAYEPYLQPGQTIPWLGDDPAQSTLTELLADVLRRDHLAGLLGFGLGSQGDFSGADCTDANLNLSNFMGADLTGTNFTGAVMVDAMLARTKLTGAKLYGTNLTDSVLADADLTQADLRMGNLRSINFLRARLPGADLWGSDLNGSFLVQADLTGANLSHTDCRRVHFEKSCLRGTSLAGADLSEASLLYADAAGADLRDTDLTGANLSGCDLTGALLQGANLHGANLTSAKLSADALTGCDLTGAILPGKE